MAFARPPSVFRRYVHPRAARAGIAVLSLMRIQGGIVLRAFEFVLAVHALENVSDLPERPRAPECGARAACRAARRREGGRHAGRCRAGSVRRVTRAGGAQLHGISWSE